MQRSGQGDLEDWGSAIDQSDKDLEQNSDLIEKDFIEDLPNTLKTLESKNVKYL